MTNVAIVIPVYKEHISDAEIISLKQLMTVLGEFPIILVCPQDLDIRYYIDFCADLRIIRFDNSYFRSIEGYNKLLLSELFFYKLRRYEYILIHQLDAYVFRNELEYWCSLGYDFIGAPWFEGWDKATINSKMTGVGNGGFSLRNVKKCLKIQRRLKNIKLVRDLWANKYLSKIISADSLLLYLKFFFKLTDIDKLTPLCNEVKVNEDAYWSNMVPNVFTDYKVPNVENAMKFSFEVNPSLLYSLNNHKLPFGCHAWEKYEPEFWKRHIHPLEIN